MFGCFGMIFQKMNMLLMGFEALSKNKGPERPFMKCLLLLFTTEQKNLYKAPNIFPEKTGFLLVAGYSEISRTGRLSLVSSFAADAQSFSAFGSSGRKNTPTVGCTHSRAEAMFVPSFTV